MFTTYRKLLGTPGALSFFCAASAGRVGIAMTSLGIVWLIRARTGSFALAGLVAGAFAIAEGIAGPQLARLIDRYGQTRVLLLVVPAHAVAAAGLLTSAHVNASAWQLGASGVVLGATIPQLGALSAARWVALLRVRDPAVLPSAFALESVVNATAFLIGPVLISALGAAGLPSLGSVVAAGLIVVGGLGLALARRTAPAPYRDATDRAGGWRTLLRPGFAVLLGANVAIGLYFGANQVAVTAFAVERDVAAAAAPIFAVSSGGGLLAGWLYGLRRWRTAENLQLLATAAVLLAGCLPLLLVESVGQLTAVVLVTGAVVPPTLVLFAVLTERAVHPAVLTQALTWTNSASAAGSAAAAAVSGRAVDALGADGGFGVIVLAAALLLLCAGIGVRVLRSARERPSFSAG